jgi:HNH endonuclease
MVAVHRLIWEWTNGPIPDGLGLLHACDNPPCCNPGHLAPGTSPQNTADRDRKGRQTRGPMKLRHRRARPVAIARVGNYRRLTAAEVVVIRQRYRDTATSYQRLALEFDSNASTIGRVIRGETWRDA